MAYCDTVSQLMTSTPTPTEERNGELELSGGRRLSYATLGAPAGPLVVVLDGPGSRGLARAAAPIAAEIGLRLVAPDRPGWGATTLDPKRGIADWPADHAALLDALGEERAGVLSQSGGTPFALAAAAQLPGRVAAISLIGAVGQLDDPAVMKEAGGQVRSGARLSRRMPWLLRVGLGMMARRVAKDPEKSARRFLKNVPASDAKALEDPGNWALHVRATSEILSRPDALAHEMGLLARPWGIDLGQVHAPLHFWTGELDGLHPPSHARRLAGQLGGAPVDVVPGAATFGMLAIYADALRFASSARSSTC
jgi:pimeloyl-ACP methyl ester carboxylesterase